MPNLKLVMVAESMVSSPTNHVVANSKYDQLPPAGQYLQGELRPANEHSAQLLRPGFDRAYRTALHLQ